MSVQFRIGVATMGYRGGSIENNYILQDIKVNVQDQILFADIKTSELSVDIEDGNSTDISITVEGAY